MISALGETGEPDTHSLQKMPYLMHTIKEAQRCNAERNKQLLTVFNFKGLKFPKGLYSLLVVNITAFFFLFGALTKSLEQIQMKQ